VPPSWSTAALTLLALIAFAANSLLTRLAVGAQAIDAATFNAVRFGSGAVALALIVRASRAEWPSLRSTPVAGPLALILYAAPFSFAYVRIGAAVGALVLFGVVQLTMVAYGILRGERPAALTWLGLTMATSGLLLLMARSVTRPDPIGVLLMAVAGVGWGWYSIVGRTALDPVATNASNFLWSAPVSVLLPLVTSAPFATGRGVVLALLSGIVATALGYVAWYRALPRLAVTQAAVAQLSVPVLAAAGGVILLGEPLNARLIVSGAAVLGGIALTRASRTSPRR
jgi:drug/metabolite transporter (DMT)-like permease